MSPLEVKIFRKRLGMSLEHFSYLVDCSRQSIYLWEKGKSKPSKLSLEKIETIKGLVETPIKCSSCGKEGTPRVLRLDDYWLVRCKECGVEIKQVKIPQDPMVELLKIYLQK